MKIRISLVILAAWFVLPTAVDSMGAERDIQRQEKARHPGQLVTPGEIEGRVVQTRQGDQIGVVDTVILDHREGRIAYVVVTSGGFWGAGGEKVVIPWQAMSVQEARLQVLDQDQWKRQPGVKPGVEGELQSDFRGDPVLVLDVDREVLMNAPQGEIQDTMDRRQAERIHRYYGVSPYWERGR